MTLPFRIPPILAPSCRRLAGAALLLGSLCTGRTAEAQSWDWYPAANPDFTLTTGIAGVQNTGSERVALAGQFLRVMCWDGSSPGVGWAFGGSTQLGNTGTTSLRASVEEGPNTPNVANPRVMDPDVVIDPSTARRRGAFKTDVLVTYYRLGQVFYRVFEYDSQLNTMTTITTALLDSSGINPNVDVDMDGHAVMTWTSGGRIYARAYDMPSRTIYPRCEITADPHYAYTQPDVAVYEKKDVVSFIYVATDGGGAQTVEVKQYIWGDIASQPSINTIVPSIPVLWGGKYDAPRLAAPPDFAAYFAAFDFQAVVGDGSTNQIIGLNYNNQYNAVDYGNQPTQNILNQYGGMDRLATCSRPVVAYCGDNMVFSWLMADDMGSYVRNGSQEVIQMNASWDGDPYNDPAHYGGNPPTPYYKIVNMDEKGNQLTPSVAGRFTEVAGISSNGIYALYCFYDDAAREIRFKEAYYAAGNLRTSAPGAAPAQPIVAYPNPFQDVTTLTLALADNEAVQSLDVYDRMGQPVRGLKLPQAEARGAQQVRWDATGLEPGLYQVRVRTSSGNTYTYRVQHD